jgi:hypothetical protein
MFTFVNVEAKHSVSKQTSKIREFEAGMSDENMVD